MMLLTAADIKVGSDGLRFFGAAVCGKHLFNGACPSLRLSVCPVDRWRLSRRAAAACRSSGTPARAAAEMELGRIL